jgi:hypothetical protein
MLAAAVRQFQAELEPTQNVRLLAHSSKPDATSILAFTAEVDSINAHRRSRCVSSRLFGVLQSVQDFTTIADTFISAHPEIAALVWGSVKLTILVYPFNISIRSSLRDPRLSITLHPSSTNCRHASSDWAATAPDIQSTSYYSKTLHGCKIPCVYFTQLSLISVPRL